MRERYGDALPTFTREQSESLGKSCDFFALNHYTSLFVRDAPESVETNSYLPGRAIDWRETAIGPDCATEIGPVSSEPWLRDVPWGLRKTLAYVARRYGSPPTVVTENGVAERGEGPVHERVPEGDAAGDRGGRRGRSRVLRVEFLR
jgi:beta-glucosidase/6-phospho-beta-glucosidase/beta-galactosidase